MDPIRTPLPPSINMSTENGAASSSNGASSSVTTNAGDPGSEAAQAASQNMHFDQSTGRWIFENPETGEEFEWNTVANTWVPVADEDVVQAQQAAYNVEGVDESAPTTVMLARDRRKKRKLEDAGDSKKKKVAKPKPGPRNTAVYVQHLPSNATNEEVSAVFGKAGMILLDADGKPKVKLYTDAATGMQNGEALVVYYKEESVELALSLLDGTPLRLGEKENMKVIKANFEHKEGKEKQEGDKKKGKSDAERQRMQKRAEKLQKEAADYDPSYDEKDSHITEMIAATKSIGGRVVVLQHVFTLEELEQDASLLLDLKEDIREECENLGKVNNVTLYDKEADGIVSVKFADEASAKACVKKNNGRFFGGRQLKAWIYDGKTRYEKSGSSNSYSADGDDADAAEKKRLESFAQWLEDDETA